MLTGSEVMENVPSKTDVICTKVNLTQSRKQLEVLSTFVPDIILNMKNNKHAVRQFMGIILSATVSGLNSLSEIYRTIGTEGNYKITTTLNSYIGAVVETLQIYGGDLLSYSEDYFQALWVINTDVCLHEIIHKVIVCALFMQQKLGNFETDINVVLKMKIAVACGNLVFTIVGNDYYKHYVLLGDPVNDIRNIERIGDYGDTVVAPSAWGHLPSENYNYTTLENGIVKVTQCVYKSSQVHKEQFYVQKKYYAIELCDKHINHRHIINNNESFLVNLSQGKLIEKFIDSFPKREARHKAVEYLLINDIKPFIIKPVLNQIDEMQPLEFLSGTKEVTTKFIEIVPHTFNVAQLLGLIDKSYQIICEIVYKRSGTVIGFFITRNGIAIEVMYGLNGKRFELCCRNALKSSFLLNQKLEKLENVRKVSIGITNGYIYSGVVGHPHRRHYIIIGKPIARAVQMVEQYSQKITCDSDTYSNSRLPSSFFQLLTDQKEGTKNPKFLVFEYNEYLEQFEVDSEDLQLIERQKELDLIHLVINHTETIDNLRGVCIKGAEKVGKTYLLRAAAKACYNEGHNISTIDLEVGSQRPYFCVSLVYRQLYNKRTVTENIDLPRELWCFMDEINQSNISCYKKTDVQNVIKKKLIDVCQFQNSNIKKTVIFIDNIQIIDNKSLVTLLSMAKENNIRIICAGQFEAEPTWDTLFKFCLNDYIKVHEIKALSSNHIPLLISNKLNVDGVGENLLLFLQKYCEGRPGWIENWLLWLQNRDSLVIKYTVKDEYNTQFTFPRSTKQDNSRIYTVVQLLTKPNENTLNVKTIALELFNHLSLFQQLVIKTASTFDDIFKRSLLFSMMNSSGGGLLTTTIKDLFENGIFDCGSKYLISGNLFKEQLSCHCDVKEKIWKRKFFPKYAFCELIHFNDKKLKGACYELLTNTEKKEMHLKITDVLDDLDKSCTNCSLEARSANVIKLRNYKYVKEMCLNKNNSSAEEATSKVFQENYSRENDSHEVVDNKGITVFARVQNSCFCLEFLIRIYADLIRHSDISGCVEKKFYFLIQYGIIMLKMYEIQQAISIFALVDELFELECSNNNMISESFLKFMKAILHSNLAHAFLLSNKMSAAKNHILISFKNYNVPFSSLISSCIGKPMLYSITLHKPNSRKTIWNSELSSSLFVASYIFTFQNDLQCAASAVTLGLELAQCANDNTILLSDLYCMALYIYMKLNDKYMCEKLQINISNVVNIHLRNNSIDLYSMYKLYNSIFEAKLRLGLLNEAIEMGFELLELNTSFQWFPFLCQFLPVFATVLLFNKRINDAVYVGQILYNIAQKSDKEILLLYYVFCLELMLESNFCVEPFMMIQVYAEKYIAQKNINADTEITLHENSLFILLFCYYMRHNELKKAMTWKVLIKCNCDEVDNSFRVVTNLHKYLETSIELLVKNADVNNNFNLFHINKLKPLLEHCDKMSLEWKIYRPRFLHLAAYFYRTRNKKSSSNTFLKQSLKEAENQKNRLEMAWCTINSHYWQGGFSFTIESKIYVDWKLSHLYNLEQWSQILYPLSIHHFP